jgi:hypothetical protein
MFLFIDLDPCYRSLALLPGNRLGPNGLLSVSQPGRPVPYNRLLLEALRSGCIDGRASSLFKMMEGIMKEARVGTVLCRTKPAR